MELDSGQGRRAACDVVTHDAWVELLDGAGRARSHLWRGWQWLEARAGTLLRPA